MNQSKPPTNITHHRWICGLIFLLSGCVGFGPRPLTYAPMSQPNGSAISPTPAPVAPQTQPYQSNRPQSQPPQSQPTAEPEPSQPAEERRSNPGSELVLPPIDQDQELEDAPSWNATDEETDYETWRPVNPPLPAPGEPTAINLGQSAAFPNRRTTPVKVSAAQTSTPTSVSRVDKYWVATAQSCGKRPIAVARRGQGENFTLVIGSIYGNEPEAIQLVDQLNRATRTDNLPGNTVLLMIRTPNPDGDVEKIRTNHKGVELNRNFPSLRFTLTPNSLTGPHPGSECETKFVLRVLKEYNPSRVVHVRSSIGNRPLVLLNDRWNEQDIRRQLASVADVAQFRTELKAGSLEEFVHERTSAQLATVHLPPRGFSQMNVSDLTWLATHQLEAAKPSRFDSSNLAGTSTPGTPTASPKLDGRRGNVELLSPPPELARSADPGNAAASARFEELPPPPR